MNTLLNRDPALPDSTGGSAAHRSGNAPRMLNVNNVASPAAPATIDETGLTLAGLNDLILKLACSVPHLTSEWAAQRLCLPEPLLEKLLWQLKDEQLVEVLGQSGELDYRYAVTQRGREFGRRASEISGYVGPAPVSAAAYRTMLDRQLAARTAPTLDQIRAALGGIVLPDRSVEVAALAALSGRSLFVFGPPGNGKTSLARLLHQVISGDLWIPYCISVDSSVIRIFDPQVHQAIDDPSLAAADIDRRWIRIRPPLVVAGGEMTLAELDLSYSPSHRFYEAPPRVKANGGTFIIDDFGRQRVEPHELLNRWIIPLEQRVDYLTLHTGQKFEMPFRLMLTVATNLDVNAVADAAFLRRMGYRLLLDKPAPDTYTDIFRRYAAAQSVTIPDGLLDALLRRYADEARDLRASEPRDLIERTRDICRLRQRPFALDLDAIDLAWRAYFGQA